MSNLKTLFATLVSAIPLTGLLVIMPGQISHADVSVNINLGQHFQHRPHHGFSGHRHYRSPSAGITGHRSFGLDPRLTPRKYPTYQPRYRHYDTRRSPPHSAYYRYRGSNISIVVPLISSQRYPDTTLLRNYGSNRPTTIAQPKPSSGHTVTNGWEALSRYETGNAIKVFTSQSTNDPQASLPQVGFALATALQGESDKALRKLDLALQSDTGDLRYFSADPGLQLVIDDLLNNYHNPPLMTATLLYLKQDYLAAESALQKALSECDNCTGPRKMQHLIRLRSRG